MAEFMKLIPQFNMQSTLLCQMWAQIQERNENEEFIQILFSGNKQLLKDGITSVYIGHWICIWYHKNIIHVSDSINSGLNTDHLKFISRLFPNNLSIKVVEETVQKQQKTFNCGLYAIANVVAIYLGICPCNIIYQENLMRYHLKKIFQTGVIEMFPNLQTNLINSQIYINRNQNLLKHKFPLLIKNVQLSSYHDEYTNSITRTESSLTCIDLTNLNIKDEIKTNINTNTYKSKLMEKVKLNPCLNKTNTTIK